MNTVALPSPAAPWRRFAPALLVLAAMLLLFRETGQAMVAIWLRSETYAHAFLVLPISAWLVWRRRERLVGVPIRPAPWVLLPMLAVCGLWLLGEMAAAQALTQFALVALLVLCVPATLGLAFARQVLFPLLFLFFAVPVGEFMVPTMMEWTADFAVAAVRLSGLPVYREGLEFVLPSGNWSVVEACSGVRYLIASFMVGTLFAYINYQSTRRRVLFMAVSIIVPVLANWVRAYMIVMLGHVSGMTLAVGADHLIYGWVFFGVVIGLMFFIGARWAEPDAPAVGAGANAAGPQAAASPAWMVGAGAVLLLGLTQAAAWKLEHQAMTPVPALQAPAAPGGWQVAEAPLSTWQPAYKGYRTSVGQTYQQSTERAAVWVAYYRNQGYDNKLISSTNLLAEAIPGAAWAQAERGTRSVDLAGGSVLVRAAQVQTSLTISGAKTQVLRVWRVYRIGDQFVAGDTRARLQLALNRMLGRGDDAAIVMLYTDTPGEAQADALLQRFAASALPALAGQLDALRAGR